MKWSLAFVTASIIGYLPRLLPLSCCCSVSERSCSFVSAALAFSLFITNCSQMLLMLVWVTSEPWVIDDLVCLPDFPYLHHQFELSSTAQARQPNEHINRRHGQLSCSHALWGMLTCTCASRDSSIVLTSQCIGSILPNAAAYERQGQLSCYHTLGPGSLVPSPLASDLLCCPSEKMCQETLVNPNRPLRSWVFWFYFCLLFVCLF